MRWLLLAFVLVIGALAIWVRALRPRKTYCTVYELGDHLTRVLNKLLDKGEGFAVVEAGKHVLQFCPRPVGLMTRDKGVLIVDVPVQQFGFGEQSAFPTLSGEIYDAFEENGFSLNASSGAFQKNAPSIWDAKMAALGVFYQVFGWQDDDLIILTEDYSKPERPK